MPKIKRNCKECGIEFEVWPYQIERGGGKYCSRNCRNEARRERIEKTCEWCREIFEIWPSRMRRGAGKFCSIKCRANWISANLNGKKSHSWRGGKDEIICLQCGGSFYNWKSQNSKFCSKNCQSQWRSENLVGEKAPTWQHGKAILECRYCGREFEEYEAITKRGKGKFCSKDCHNKWMLEKGPRGKDHPLWVRVYEICEQCGKIFETRPCEEKRFCSQECFHAFLMGENHPSWKGGISLEPYGSEWTKELRQTIRKRDEHKCAICGREKAYCVHHINYQKDDHRLENLITLDRFCHGKTNFNRRFWQTILSPLAQRRTVELLEKRGNQV